MRKYFLVLLTIFALCLFTGMALAQSQSSTSPNSETQGTMHNGQATNPGDANSSTTSPSVSGQSSSGSVGSQPASGSSTGVQGDQSNSASNSGSDSESAGNSGAHKTLEGCLVKENTDYFIEPMNGQREKLNSTEDLSSKVGKKVRVEGSEQDATASSASSSSPSNTSGSGSAETQNNAAGSIAGNAGSSNATGTGASAAGSNSREFQVTKIETVSESCPASAQK